MLSAHVVPEIGAPWVGDFHWVPQQTESRMRIRWKGFELPTQVVLDEASRTATYGKFMVEPFERGFATTLGDSIKNTLYRSIEGAAVTSIWIKGANAESTSIKGVEESVTDVVLNLKELGIQYAGDGDRTLKVEVSKKGVVTAKQLVSEEDDVEVLNPDLHICTLTENVNFSLKVTIKKGRRYVSAGEHPANHQDKGSISVDSSFSPVKRVQYKVQSMRLGKFIHFERLILEVWTDGTTTPENAVSEASRLLNKHFMPFVQYFELGRELQIDERKEEKKREKEAEKEELRRKLSMAISELDLSVRSSNCLTNEGIETIEELVRRNESDLVKLRNFGKTSLREIRRKLSEMNLTLGMDVDKMVGKKEALLP